jgi:hypothetical protein
MRLVAPLTLVLLVLSLAGPTLPLPARAERSVGGEEELLPIGETPEEAAFRAAFPRGAFTSDPPPLAPVRNCAEFEPSTGALIRYPLGIPYNLIQELTEDVMVHVVVSSAYQSQAVASFTAAGINMSRVEWVVAPTTPSGRATTARGSSSTGTAIR